MIQSDSIQKAVNKFMKDESRTNIKVGITVFAALILLIWIIGWAKNVSLGSERIVFRVMFANSSGLEVGDLVTVNGVRKGFVESIEILPQAVVTTLSIEPDIDLRSDASIRLTMLDLMGGKKIDISPGIAVGKLNISDVTQGVLEADIPQLIAFVGSLKNDFPRIMAKIDTALSAMNSILTDQTLKTDLKTSLANLSVSSEMLKQVLRESSVMLAENRANLRELIAQSIQLTKEAQSLIADGKTSLLSITQKVETLTSESTQLLSKFDSLIEETTNKQNNLGKLLYDSDLLSQTKDLLKKTQEAFDILLKQLQSEGINVNAKINF